MGWKLIKPSRALSVAASRSGFDEPPGSPRIVPLGEARGRLALLAAAWKPWPVYPRVELDGCGVRAGSVRVGSKLRVSGRLRPFSRPAILYNPTEECLWTDTGAPLPIGADAVAPREVLDTSKDYVVVRSDVEAWRAISLPASDVATGDPVLIPGRLATAEAVAGAAGLGFTGLPVDAGSVRVCVASIGDELVEPWEEGAVKDSNRYQIAARLRRAGVEVIDLGIVRDDVSEVLALIAEASRRGCRVLVTSGGTSVGLSDPVPAAVREEGEILVHGLRMRPGRPTLIGLVSGVLVVGLPGNPRSAGNVAENVLLPLLTLLSFAQAGRGYVEATLAYTLENRGERPAHIPVALLRGREGLLAVPVARESFMVLSWPLASASLEVKPGERIPAGSLVDVYAYADSYKAAVDAADSGLTTVNGLPLIKVPLGGEASEASETARSHGIPYLSVSPSSSTRVIVARRLIVKESSRETYSVECAAPRSYEHLCPDDNSVLAAPRVESARLLASQGYSRVYAGPLSPWEEIEGKPLGKEYILFNT